MKRCCVPFCNGPGGHRFPKDITIRKLWLKAIRRVNLVPNEGTRLCRQHFTDDDYIKRSIHTGTKHQHNYLQKCAVPSIFPWTKTTGTKRKQNAVTHTRTFTKSSKEVTTSSEEKARIPVMCSVPQCISNNTTEGVTFHPLPMNKSIRKKWIEILNLDITKSIKVCSLHFNQSDFVTQDGSSGNPLLKRNILPTQKQYNDLLPTVEHQKIESSLSRMETMSDTTEPSTDFAEEGSVTVCRACLRNCGRLNTLCDIFQAWSPPWLGMEPTIAEDLAKIAHIEVIPSDLHPKHICHSCYQNLLDAATFVAKVRYCNSILKQRCPSNLTDTKTEYEIENNWPKPIQIDKNINGSVYESSMDIDIKKEVLSEEEYGNESVPYMMLETGLDIKVEQEEIEEPPPMQITINGTMSLNPNTNNPVMNGIEKHGEQHLEVVVKQEPLSAEEDDEVVHDLPLECMLCAKSFHKLSGLKAHVIAEHSYKSVKRKSSSRPSPEKKQKNSHRHICQICKRCFDTTTDLMVHETCHNMFTCYGCNIMFDSFEKLSKHRMTKCKASNKSTVQRPKTLDDVMRPQLENSRFNSPTLDTRPISQTDTVIELNPVSDTNLVCDTNVVLETSPVSDMNLELDNSLVSDIKQVSDTNPVLEKNPASEPNLILGNNQGLDIQAPIQNQDSKLTSVPGTNPESDTNLVSGINAGLDMNQESEIIPESEAIRVSEVNPVSDTKPTSEASPVSETNPVSENNLEPDTKPVSDTKKINKEVYLNNTIDKSESDISDSSMKLHLEIHSAKQESVPMDINEVDLQDNVEMEVKSSRGNDNK